MLEQKSKIEVIEKKIDLLSELLLRLLEEEEEEPLLKDLDGNEIPRNREGSSSLDLEQTKDDGGL